MTERASMEVTLGGAARGRRRSPEEPVRILVLGDFSGRGDRPEPFTPRKVTFESVDEAIVALAPSATIAFDSPLTVQETLDIRSLDDFHPDALVRRVGAFRSLQALGKRLSDASTQDEALLQLGELTGSPAATEEDRPPEAAPAVESESDTLDRLLGASAGASPRTRAQDKVQSFIQEVMASAPTETPSPASDVGQQVLNDLISELMRAVLRSPALRSLERAWRSLDWLIRRLDDEVAEVHALDFSKESLANHVADNVVSLDRSALHRLLNEPATVDAWDIVVGDYTFGFDAVDLTLVASIGAIASKAGMPFLAGGDLDLCGCDSIDKIDTPEDWWLTNDDIGQLWVEVRSHPAAQSVGLAAPRMLLRQPYGAETDPIDSFDFEELTPNPEHESFFWANPAFGCACLLAVAQSEQPFEVHEIDDMPTVLFDDGTGQALQPPVEVLLTERSIHQMQASGLIAMVAHRGGNAIRCPYLTTISMGGIDLLA
jgi:type VI secretion system protein ImpC